MTQPIVINDYPSERGKEILQINPGRITFIIGKPGAGKTALLAALAERGAYPINACVGETVESFMAGAEKRHAKWDKGIAREALEEFGITAETESDVRVSALLPLIEALACREDFVLLDEPAKSLENADRKSFYMLLRDFCKGGSAFVVASSEVMDAEVIIDDVVFLKDGKLVIAEDKRSLLSRAVYVSGHCVAAEVNTAGLEQYGVTSNGKVTTMVCLLAKGEAVGGSCDVSVMNIGLQTLFDFMCGK